MFFQTTLIFPKKITKVIFPILSYNASADRDRLRERQSRFSQITRNSSFLTLLFYKMYYVFHKKVTVIHLEIGSRESRDLYSQNPESHMAF